jgi:hypothetical protein
MTLAYAYDPRSRVRFITHDRHEYKRNSGPAGDSLPE